VTIPATDGSVAADARWLATLERLQRGLNHAMSNRIASLASVISILEPGDVELVRQLGDEMTRLERLLALLRLLPRPSEPRAEPVQVADFAHDVGTLLAHHPGLRDERLVTTGLEAAPPVRCRLHALQHALLLLLEEAGLAGAPLALAAHGTDAALTLTVGAAAGTQAADEALPGIARDDAGRAAQALLAADEALVWTAGEGPAWGAWIRLPTLLALRARERARA
jgi:hypothetical protein